MRLRSLLLVTCSYALAAVACSGKADGISENGTGGSSQGGSGNAAGSCPTDLQRAVGDLTCTNLLPGCGTGLCFSLGGGWTCTSPCPCPEGWTCDSFPAGLNACIPEALAGCPSASQGGAGGAGGFGGAGGMAGSGGTGVGGIGPGGTAGDGGSTPWGGGGGGPAGAGGTGGTGLGGSGPCSGHPACPLNVAAKFCDDVFLLDCAAGDSCGKETNCSQLCSGCTCHVAPPINGVLNAGCDSCLTDNDCQGGLKCLDDPMLKGSGAKACVMN